MDDETKTVADYKIVKDGFIVMMTVKVSIFPSTFGTEERREHNRMSLMVALAFATIFSETAH